MDDIKEPEQECPFCYEVWGQCEHYELMIELEAEAECVEDHSSNQEPNKLN